VLAAVFTFTVFTMAGRTLGAFFVFTPISLSPAVCGVQHAKIFALDWRLLLLLPLQRKRKHDTCAATHTHICMFRGRKGRERKGEGKRIRGAMQTTLGKQTQTESR